MGAGFGSFALTSKTDSKKDLYQVFFGPTYKLTDRTGQEESVRFSLPEPIGSEFREFWLTWYSNVIRMGVDGEPEPILIYENDKIGANNIGYIKFYLKSVRWIVEWIFEASPVILKPLKEKCFDCGYLHWKILQENDRNLPDDALVAGFENEPIYITRAQHNGSLVPGKYVRSEQCGFVPWGGREHRKQTNQILCGFDVKWVKTYGNFIPENAYVAGFSEIRHEPLYVGRAMYDNQLLIGKVHPLYSTCYLPYKGKEIEVHEYEILVTAKTPRAIFSPVPINISNVNRNAMRQFIL